MVTHARKSRGKRSFELPRQFWVDLKPQIDCFLSHRESEVGGFATKYLRSEIFSKLNDPSSGSSPSERKTAAIDKWLAAESRNSSTNYRLMWNKCSIAGVSSESVLRHAARFIRGLIGDEPDIEWNFHSTNGASTRVRRGEVASALKFEGKAHSTERAIRHWQSAIEGTLLSDFPGLACPEIVEGSVLFTVPKNATIDRVACKEPEVNQWLQRAVGISIRNSLRRVGIDLLDQSRNQRLAREGSLTGELATIDLSSASDLISRTLVNRLLPVSWYVLLDDIRVHHVRLPSGEQHECEMFSSMGNGFTFELETLIFWALASAVQYCFHIRGPVAVYGDDIIVGCRTARLLRHFFAFFGFKVNAKKSFWTGKFRESCGGHYFNGKDVTPFYVRKPIVHTVDLIQFLNQFREWSVRTAPYAGYGIDYPFWRDLSTRVDKRFHGGRSTERTDSLVSPCKPRMVLVRSHEEVRRPELGSLLLWYSSAEHSPEVEVRPVKHFGFVIRRNRTWDLGVPLFCEEFAE